MTGAGDCSLVISPAEARVCPGETLALSVVVAPSPPGGAQIAARVREGGAQPEAVRTRVTSREEHRITATVMVAAAHQGDDYPIDVSCVRGGEEVASSAAMVRVRRIHLEVSSLEVDPDSMSGKVAVVNCSGLTPEVNLRLACREGRVVFDVSVRARLRAHGRDIHEFHIADRSVDLGSCRLELVDGDGNLLDRLPLGRSSGPPVALGSAASRAPKTPKVPYRAITLASALLLLVGVLWWFRPGPDEASEFSLGVQGSGAVHVEAGAGDPFSVDRTTTFGLEDDETIVELTAEPSPGWDFTGWSDGRIEPRISVSAGDSGIVAEFAEAAGLRLPDLTLLPNDRGAEIEVSLEPSASGCEVAFVVLNQGGRAGVPFSVTVVVDGPDGGTGAAGVVGPMGPGEQREVQVFVAGADFCQFDPNSEGSVTLDGGNVVVESDEANNTGGWLIIG